MMLTNFNYAGQRFIQRFGKDTVSYYGSALQKIGKGNIKQGVTDMFNLPKFFGFLVDRNYSGGTKQLTKDVQNPTKVTDWMVQAGAMSPEMAKPVKQGNVRYGTGRAAGEVTGVVLALVFPGVVKTASGPIRNAFNFTRSAPETEALLNVSKKAPLETWGRVKTLEKHFKDHGKDFGSVNKIEYVKKGSEFFIESQRNGYPTIIDKTDGAIRTYDSATDTFGAYNADGTTRTIYKPNSPGYWQRQVAKYGDTPPVIIKDK